MKKNGEEVNDSTHQVVAVAQLRWNRPPADVVDGNLSITRLFGGGVTEIFSLRSSWGEEAECQWVIGGIKVSHIRKCCNGVLVGEGFWHVHKDDDSTCTGRKKRVLGIGCKMYMGVLIDFNVQSRN